MHTDSSLKVLLQVTTALGNRLRTFQEQTCSVFPTRELQREQTARLRRQVKSSATTESALSNSNELRLPNSNEPGPSKSKPRNNGARLPKKLNLRTYKFHSLGDYHYNIRRFGTVDSYSTQPVSFLDTVPEPPDIDYLLERTRA
jgi:hypothetical protein